MFRRLRSRAKQLRSKAYDILKRLLRQNVDLPDVNEEQIASLIQRAMDLSSRYEELGEIDDLNEAIVLGREALSLCAPGHPERSVPLNNLAVYLSSRCKLLGEIDDLNEAIIFDCEALLLRPPGHPERSLSLNNLAGNLFFRFQLLGEIGDLNQAIAHCREALSLHPSGHPDRLVSLNNLTVHLSSRFKLLGEIDDLNEAIVLDREVLSLRPPGDPRHAASLNNLSVDLSFRYKVLGGTNDLNEAIVLDKQALSLRPPGHPDRSGSLSNLATHLSFRYNLLGKIDDLDEAIVLGREALSILPSGHSGRSLALSNLGVHLSSRHKLLGKVEDLDEAIVLDQEALTLRPPGHPERSSSLNNLANRISSRYNQLGQIGDLNEAILLVREALSLCSPGYTHRTMFLNNLANHLSSRYSQLGGIDDLNEAIIRNREALSLRPPGHPDRSTSLNNLAVDISSRYNLLREIDDLNEAIVFVREALSLVPPLHPLRFSSLNNLALHLSSRYDRLGAIDDLNEAVILDREALSLCTSGHPDRSSCLGNFAVHLSYRFELLGGIEDLNEAIVLDWEALSLRPLGHPDRSMSLSNLAARLLSRYKLLVGSDDTAAIEDRHELFSLYAELDHVSQIGTIGDLYAAKAWATRAEEFQHPTTLLAYETALRLLVENTAALPPLPHHLALLQSFSTSLAVDAFSACLRNQSPAKAVELLEQGRAVFWSQLTRLRSPLDDVMALGPEGKALADEFTNLTSFVRNLLNSPSPDQHNQVCHLNLELQKVVSGIRELPGLSRFLLPSLFSDLQVAATDGPVVIVNASKYGCDALIVFSDKDPVHIPLPITTNYIQGLSSKLLNLRRLANRKGTDPTADFKWFLQELWDNVVSHIVGVLRETCPLQSRIWWCPTAEFSLLPLHAAAPYRNGQSVSDLYIPSYTTTLTALIRARRPGGLISDSGKKRFIAIGQAKAPGLSKLPSIRTELENIQRHVNNVSTFTCVSGKSGCVAIVTDRLRENEWVHFACHGVTNKQRPFQSAFALRDGMFTIQRIIQCNLENPEFAYLSACHTTVGDQEHPDEVIHLASAMQFAGFRSVIGTMWSVADAPATKVASTFYAFMVDETGGLDYTRAAWALWKTLRTVDIPLDQRILYIHLGA